MSQNNSAAIDQGGIQRRHNVNIPNRQILGGTKRNSQGHIYPTRNYYTPSNNTSSSQKRIRYGQGDTQQYGSRSIEPINKNSDIEKLLGHKDINFERKYQTAQKGLGFGDDNFATKSAVQKLMSENSYLKDKFSKLRRNYNTLEQTHAEIKTYNPYSSTFATAADLDTQSIDLNSLVIESTLRKENRQLNEILKETIQKNEKLINRVGFIEKEQKKEIKQLKNDVYKKLNEEKEKIAESEIFRLKDRVAKLEGENGIQQLDIERLKQQKEDLEKDIINLKKQHNQELADTKSEIDLRWLRKHEQSVKEGFEQNNEIGFEYRKQLDSISKKNDMLRKNLEERQSMFKELTEKRRDQDERILQLTIEVEKLKSTILCHDQNAEKALRENEILEGKLKVAAQKVELLENREKSLQKNLDELADHNLRLKKEKDNDERKLAMEKAETVHVSNTNQQCIEEIENLRGLVNEYRMRVESLENELEDLSIRNNQLSDKNLCLTDLLNDYTNKNKHLDQLKDELQEKLAIFSELNHQSSLREQDLVTQFNESKIKLEMQIAEAIAKDQESKALAKKQDGIIRDLEQKNYDQQIHLEELTHQNERLTQQNKELAQFASMERDEKLERQNIADTLNQDLFEANVVLEQSLSDKSALLQRIEELETQINLLVSQNTTFDQENRDLRRQIQDNVFEIGRLQEKYILADTKMKQYLQDFTLATKDKTDLQQDVRELVLEISKIKAENQSVAKHNKALKDVNHTFEARQILQLQNLIQRMAKMGHDLDHLASQNTGLTRKLILVEGMAESAEQTNVNLKKNLAQSEDIVHRVTQEVYRTKQEKNEVIKQHIEAQNQSSKKIAILEHEKYRLCEDLSQKPAVIKEIHHHDHHIPVPVPQTTIVEKIVPVPVGQQSLASRIINSSPRKTVTVLRHQSPPITTSGQEYSLARIPSSPSKILNQVAYSPSRPVHTYTVGQTTNVSTSVPALNNYFSTSNRNSHDMVNSVTRLPQAYNSIPSHQRSDSASRQLQTIEKEVKAPVITITGSSNRLHLANSGKKGQAN